MPRRVTRDDVFLRAAMRDHGASVLRLALAQTGSRAMRKLRIYLGGMS